MSGALDKDVAMSQGVSILGDFADVERLRRDDWLTPPTEGLIRQRPKTSAKGNKRLGGP
jgi:hypothetical protein